uniref:CUB domain-containing protein n=1 Tax=Branchiostoma floridae TaxID=7739 RepID=C3Y152_BRAFL|eukprot:XP_002609582.1 hypothetical protein BRAFLDRAFT_87795 [Branchiostoma floridae]
MLPDSPTTSGSTLHRHRRSKHVQAEDADRRFALVPAPRDGRSGTPKGPRGFSGIAGSVYGGRCLVPRKAGTEKDDGLVQEAVLGFSATICFSLHVYECVPGRAGNITTQRRHKPPSTSPDVRPDRTRWWPAQALAAERAQDAPGNLLAEHATRDSCQRIRVDWRSGPRHRPAPAGQLTPPTTQGTQFGERKLARRDWSFPGWEYQDPFDPESAAQRAQQRQLRFVDFRGQPWDDSNPNAPDICSTPEYTAPSGNITSPNYPADYTNRLDCTALIRVPGASGYRLFFEDFEVEDQDGSSCKDVLEVGASDTYPLNPVLTNLCGNITIPTTTVSGPVAWLNFFTDRNVVRRGFFLRYETLAAPTPAPECTQFGGVDLVFLLDGSASVGASNFELVKDFTQQTAAKFNISDGSTR